jgi:hypothetical protein
MEQMSDREVVERLEELLRDERRLTAAVLMHLAEVEVRRLYLPAACSSMFAYCTRVLGMSEDQAFKRIRAARAVRRFPVAAAAVEDGRLHLCGVVLLAPHLTVENAEELVAEASGKSKAEIEVVLARRAPKPDVQARLDRVAEQVELVPGPPGSVAVDVVPGPPPETRAAKVAALAPDRFALQVTISEATQEKLLRAQALLRHQVPSGDLAEVLDRALDALLDRVEGRKLGKTTAPRKARASLVKRYVPRAVRREVVARDGARCSFVGEDGRRCEETGFLELDHVTPVVRGGESSADGVRVLCRAHNQYEAERVLGRDVVRAGRCTRKMDDDLVAGLRRMGVTAGDARRAVAASPRGGAVEERMRAALGALHSIYASRGEGTRCEEPRPLWAGPVLASDRTVDRARRAGRVLASGRTIYRSRRGGTSAGA